MSLIAETGAGVAGAESYVTVAQADTYWANRGNLDWENAEVEAKEYALREACQYLDHAYQWQGQRINAAQALYWPRWLYVAADNQQVKSDEIPVPIKNAQCELALLALAGDLAPVRDGTKVSSESVGSLSVTYFQTSPEKVFPIVDMMLRDYTLGKTLGGITQNAILA